YDIYHRPANIFVGTFIGSPPLNLFSCALRSEGATPFLVSPVFHLPLATAVARHLSGSAEELTLGVRPEFVILGPKREESFPARVTLIESLGSRTLIFLEARGQELRAVVQGEATVREGETVHVTFALEHAFFFDRQGRRIETRDSG
ncbi:MAG: TOBE domain-containing protein, partial [Nitrospinota bacterium]